MGFSGGGGGLVQPATLNQGSGGVALIDTTGSGFTAESRPYQAGDEFTEVGTHSVIVVAVAGGTFEGNHGTGILDAVTLNNILGLDYDTSVFPNGGSIKWLDRNAVHKGALYAGTGVPANAGGSNGDFALRTDTPGVANQRLYVKSAGAWVGIV